MMIYPKLRFIDFKQSWSLCRGVNLFKRRARKGNDSLPMYSVSQGQNFLVPRETIKKQMKGDAQVEDNFVAQGGDVAYNTMRMWQGAMGIAPTDCMVSPAYVVLAPTDMADSQFYSYLLKTPKYLHKLKSFSYGLTDDRLRLYFKDFSQIVFPSTTIKEQQKIAEFISSIDKKISQLKEKHALLQQYKKGVMQQIFTQQIRFKDDKGKAFSDWQEIKAKEIFKNHSNKTHTSNLPILSATQDGGMVYRDDIGIEIKSSEASISSYKVVEAGDFVISLRSFQGGIELSKVLGICSPAYTVLKPKINICIGFYKHYFKRESFISQLSATVIGIREGKQISYDAFSGVKLFYPEVKEQEKIATFLDTLDTKINLVAQQIEQTQQFKKGLLQQMFV